MWGVKYCKSWNTVKTLTDQASFPSPEKKGEKYNKWNDMGHHILQKEKRQGKNKDTNI